MGQASVGDGAAAREVQLNQRERGEVHQAGVGDAVAGDQAQPRQRGGQQLEVQQADVGEVVAAREIETAEAS